MSLILAVLCILLSGSFSSSQTPHHPFPHHTKYTSGTIKPRNLSQHQLDSITESFYDLWKSKYLSDKCGSGQFYVFFDETDRKDKISTSEGQGYGMMITAYMAGYDPDAKIYFDGLYNFYKAHPSTTNNRLMAWCQVEGCKDKPNGGSTSATDGDIDIAYSLLLADNQWGSNGSINYRQEALYMIDAIMKDEVNHETWTTKTCDCIGPLDRTYYDTRPSDFIIDHFRAFRSVAKNEDWLKLIDEDYYLIWLIQEKYSPATGLIPDFVQSCNTGPFPAVPNYLESANDGDYFYNSCRFPWRIATDYLIYGDKRANDALDKINEWVKLKTGSSPANIHAGYTLTGEPLAQSDYFSPAFTAPFAVSAMISRKNQTWLDDLYSYLISAGIEEHKYYDNTIKMLALIVLSKNYWSPK